MCSEHHASCTVCASRLRTAVPRAYVWVRCAHGTRCAYRRPWAARRSSLQQVGISTTQAKTWIFESPLMIMASISSHMLCLWRSVPLAKLSDLFHFGRLPLCSTSPAVRSSVVHLEGLPPAVSRPSGNPRAHRFGRLPRACGVRNSGRMRRAISSGALGRPGSRVQGADAISSGPPGRPGSIFGGG